jgi:hypothetical protein
MFKEFKKLNMSVLIRYTVLKVNCKKNVYLKKTDVKLTNLNFTLWNIRSTNSLPLYNQILRQRFVLRALF